MNHTKDAYLKTLIRQLEKHENNTHLANFFTFIEATLRTKYRLRSYLDYPISESEYDELIQFAEQMLGINPSTSGRTNDATSVESASGNNVNGYDLSGNGIYPDQWIAFTAKQDIKKGDFVLIDEHDNQSVTPAADMELSKTSWEDLQKELELDAAKLDLTDNIILTTNEDYEKRLDDFYELSDKVMEEYKESYAALGSHDDGYYSAALFSLDDVKKAMEQAQEGYKTIWYYAPFQHFFVGDITDKPDFPFIYLNEDPAHNDYVKHTPVVGPFNNVKELEDYFDIMVREEAGMDDSEFIKQVRDLVVAIKHYESKDDAHRYSTIIDAMWEELKRFLLGNI